MGRCKIPYKTLQDLPDRLRNVLPEHAQEIYRAAFNNAFEEYKNPSKKRSPEDPHEEVCHKVAWAAVKKIYKKGKDGQWIQKK